MYESSILHPDILKNPEWHKLVAQADDWVREWLKESQHGKRIEWNVRRKASGDPIYHFKMLSRSNCVEREFTTQELATQRPFQWKVSKLWGELLDRNIQDDFDNILHTLADWQDEVGQEDRPAKVREEVLSGH